MNRRFLFGLLSLFFVSASACAQTTRPAEPKDLLVGTKWAYSTDGGKTFSASPPTIKAKTTVRILVRMEFAVADPSKYVVLELTHGLPPRGKMTLTLNGNEVKGPMEGMYYKTIPAIDAKLLKKGKNVLTADVTVKNKSKDKDITLKVKMSLAALKREHLKIQTGPILGAFGKDYFTITCRTNMPAEVEMRCIIGRIIDGKSVTFQADPPTPHSKGLLHRLRIKTADLKPSCRCSLWAQHADYNIGKLFTLPKRLPGSGLRFVAMGDSRTYPEKWAKVAEAALKARPDLVVFSGDMVNRGRNDWEWDEQYFGPAKKFFATIPNYAVIGNHEDNAPLYNELFYTPSKDGLSRNWSQTINGVQLIGIDGKQDFSAGSKNGKWLEKTLADSKAKFIFFFTHYPAWTSSMHGRLDEKTGRPREKAVRQGQDVLVPLLVKYKATAFICGHDHVYERSELPGGLTHIISGGAGAPLREKSENAAKQNPYSKVFASTLHYCIFEIFKGETCTMKALTPDGKAIDTRTWKARGVSGP